MGAIKRIARHDASEHRTILICSLRVKTTTTACPSKRRTTKLRMRCELLELVRVHGASLRVTPFDDSIFHEAGE